MRGSLILDVVGRATFHTILVFALYLLFAGHNAPGGGFVGGLVAGAAFVLRYARGGTAGVEQAVRVPWEWVLAAGILLAGLTGAAGWLVGGDYLESGYVASALPVLGDVAVTTALAFDTGVFLVVVGLVLAIVDTLGGEDATSGATRMRADRGHPEARP